MNNFLTLQPTWLLYRFMHKMSIFQPNSMKVFLSNMCVNSMSMSVCHHSLCVAFF